MKYVILRDDDTNAATPVECLERLYRPFLERGLPVNLAVIPNVSTATRRPDGRAEGYLVAAGNEAASTLPIGGHRALVDYLLKTPGFRIVQHGYEHNYLEFDIDDRAEIVRRLDEGRRLLREAGFPEAGTFVAPWDRLSRSSMAEVARRYRVLSTGWFELRRVPLFWWSSFALKKLSARPHWQAGGTKLLSHPGCLLSRDRPYDRILGDIEKNIASRRLTVLVTHWWEYFEMGKPDEALIGILHQTAALLANDPGLRVVSFEDVAEGRVPLN